MFMARIWAIRLFETYCTNISPSSDHLRLRTTLSKHKLGLYVRIPIPSVICRRRNRTHLRNGKDTHVITKVIRFIIPYAHCQPDITR